MRMPLAIYFTINIVLVCAVCGAPQRGTQPADSSAVYFYPGETPVTMLSSWKTRDGDSAAWRLAGYDDSHWSIATSALWARDNGGARGIRWYRHTIFIPEPLDSLRACAVFCRAAVCASELYWDGVLITQNGRVARGGTAEVAGRLAGLTIVPQHLTSPGRHVAALCVGNARSFSGLVQFPLHIGYFDELQARMRRDQTLLLLCAGVFLIAGLFHFAVMPGRTRGVAYALFGVLCLSCGGYLLINAAVNYFPVSLSRYYVIALVNDLPWFCMMVLLPAFFLFEFTVPFRLQAAAAVAAVALACIVPPRLVTFGLLPVAWLPVFDLMNRLHMYGVTLFSAAIAFVSVLRRRSGAVAGLAGCMVLLAGMYVSFQQHVEYAWALGFCGLIVLLTLSLSRQMAEQNRRRQESELRSARLELELLKKHIQPHFLLNSLNSVIAWLEEEPSTAVRLVNALAEELRLILQFSKEKLVPVSEELRLCRLHLDVMGLRKDRAYSLSADPVPPGERVPPLVIHTLVENGLTHGSERVHSFAFRREAASGRVRYVVSNDGGSAGVDGRVGEGTGIRYVKTRLEEAFPGSWRISGGPANGGWETHIELPLSGGRT